MSDPIPPDVPEPGAEPLQRIYMDRARAEAERDLVKPPRRPLQSAIALVLSVAVVIVILMGFDKFLASVQRALHVMEEQDKVEAERQRNQEPMPAYAVAPAEERATPPPTPEQK
jgi:hypothetical protein